MNFQYLFYMKIYRTNKGIVVEAGNQFHLGIDLDWDQFINRDQLFEVVSTEVQQWPVIGIEQFHTYTLLAPLQSQEVWAAGVTYLRSRDARMEESKDAGGGSFYDRVYDADRPEIFFKSTAHRVVNPGGLVRIRKDSTWNVPEPELTLCISSAGKIIGYTIGNDMSSRSIEGENPLYLPQAKTYDGSAAIGPCIFTDSRPLASDSGIRIEIVRSQQQVFAGSITIDRMKRQHEELVGYLYRECSFPHGCLLMTGTGVVPPNEFTLASGDEIRITIDHIGTLINMVA